jgi:hypothetical protein
MPSKKLPGYPFPVCKAPWVPISSEITAAGAISSSYGCTVHYALRKCHCLPAISKFNAPPALFPLFPLVCRSLPPPLPFSSTSAIENLRHSPLMLLFMNRPRLGLPASASSKGYLGAHGRSHGHWKAVPKKPTTCCCRGTCHVGGHMGCCTAAATRPHDLLLQSELPLVWSHGALEGLAYEVHDLLQKRELLPDVCRLGCKQIPNLHPAVTLRCKSTHVEMRHAVILRWESTHHAVKLRCQSTHHAVILRCQSTRLMLPSCRVRCSLHSLECTGAILLHYDRQCPAPKTSSNVKHLRHLAIYSTCIIEQSTAPT